jgi:hypothetical protein
VFGQPPWDMRGIPWSHEGWYGGSDFVSSINGVGADNDAEYTSSGTTENTACALLFFASDTGGVNGPKAKLHVSGDLYAPTAAFDLSGKDNDAPFATDGIVARQISLGRWRWGPSQPAVGGTTSHPPGAGDYLFTAKYDGTVIATARVTINPINALNQPAVIKITCWERRSTPCT